MVNFQFRGDIPASKSILNRALICQSYFPALNVIGESGCDDVIHMKSALSHFSSALTKRSSVKEPIKIDCGEAGTVLRFMAFRVSRETGFFHLTGSPRLLARPQKEMMQILQKLGVKMAFHPDFIEIESPGWQPPESRLVLTRESSSQFASAVLLNIWNLPFNLNLEIPSGVSESYFRLTHQMIEELGCKIEKRDSQWKIAKNQQIKMPSYRCELDMSSAFPIVVAGVLAGETSLTHWDPSGFQPDQYFIEILKKMEAKIEVKGSELTVQRSNLRGQDFDLGNTPDLFPVLSVLCAFSKGVSKLYGAPHLKFKESNRILKTKELLDLIGCQSETFDDGILIHGQSFQSPEIFHGKVLNFDPDQDHRMAMAAGLLKLQKFPIQIRTPEVVTKSFPEFWQIMKSSTHTQAERV